MNVEKCKECLELDEMYWFLEHKPRTETRENVYVMTMVSRQPRQIVSFEVARDKSAWRIQRMVDSGPEAERYCTDGYVGYYPNPCLPQSLFCPDIRDAPGCIGSVR